MYAKVRKYVISYDLNNEENMFRYKLKRVRINLLFCIFKRPPSFPLLRTIEGGTRGGDGGGVTLRTLAWLVALIIFQGVNGRFSSIPAKKIKIIFSVLVYEMSQR